MEWLSRLFGGARRGLSFGDASEIPPGMVRPAARFPRDTDKDF